MIGKLRVGQIANAQGIRGEIKVYPLVDYKERFEELEYLYIEGRSTKYDIENIGYKSGLILLKIRGIEDRNAAEALRQKYLTIDNTQQRKLPEDTYLIDDLIGMKVYSENNIYIGEVVDVIQRERQDLYEIMTQKNPIKTSLVPAVGEFIKQVDVDKKKIVIKIIEGLI